MNAKSMMLDVRARQGPVLTVFENASDIDTVRLSIEHKNLQILSHRDECMTPALQKGGKLLYPASPRMN